MKSDGCLSYRVISKGSCLMLAWRHTLMYSKASKISLTFRPPNEALVTGSKLLQW